MLFYYFKSYSNANWWFELAHKASQLVLSNNYSVDGFRTVGWLKVQTEFMFILYYFYKATVRFHYIFKLMAHRYFFSLLLKNVLFKMLFKDYHKILTALNRNKLIIETQKHVSIDPDVLR